MVRETIILTRHDVERYIDMPAVVASIEQCFSEYENGLDLLPPKYIVNVPGGISACMVGYTKAAHMLTMKLGQERKANLTRGLPSLFQTIHLFDPETGELIMIAEAMLATMMRTAAAAAVGVKYLARKDAKVLAVVGAGQLGKQCVIATGLVRPFEKILVADVRPEQSNRLTQDLRRQIEVSIEATDVKTACLGADVICTATNSVQPVVMDAWVKPGTHLSCMGADIHSKIECEMSLLTRCRIVADNPGECIGKGEVSQAVEKGILESDCYAGSLGKVINGMIPGREAPEQITMFDGIGMGIQDTTIAKSLYDQATNKNIGLRVQIA